MLFIVAFLVCFVFELSLCILQFRENLEIMKKTDKVSLANKCKNISKDFFRLFLMLWAQKLKTFFAHFV